MEFAGGEEEKSSSVQAGDVAFLALASIRVGSDDRIAISSKFPH